MKRSMKKKKRFLTAVFLSAMVGLTFIAMDGFSNGAEAALTAADCRVCHIGEKHRDRISWEFVTDMGPAHHAVQRSQKMKCVDCHTEDPQTVRISDCLQCHVDDGHGIVETPPEVPVEPPPPAETPEDLPGVSTDSAICLTCHTGDWNFIGSLGAFGYNMAPAHHALQRANKWACVECHTTKDANNRYIQEKSCVECHSSSSHADEHDFVGPTAQVCVNCHDANVVVEHVANRSVDCAACHSDPAYATVIDSGRSNVAVNCDNCHGVVDHHLKPEATAGTCTYCHADPRLEINGSAPTGALACYACHGQNQHSVGPVQDFGACFACHQPIPYHGKPPAWPGWYQENQVATGRGLFNFFKTQFKPSCSGNCKSKYENRSGYGKDGQPKSKRDSNWSTPTYNNTKYTMVNITDIRGTNQQWSVPVLTGVALPGGGGGGGGGQSDSVTVTYASYGSNKVTVYAINTLTNNTALTLNYNNNNYPMTWDSNDNRWEVQVTSYTCSDSTIDVTSAAGGSDSSSVSNCSGWGW